MTNKEAISMLKSKLDGHTDTSYEWCECVRMAIKALEQETCEDCISRQTLLEEIENGIKAGNYEEGYEEYPHINDMDDIVECIKYADKVQPKADTWSIKEVVNALEKLGFIEKEPQADSDYIGNFKAYSKIICELPSINPQEPKIEGVRGDIPIQPTVPKMPKIDSDCISRQAVIEITAETGALETQVRVKALPPVTPQAPSCSPKPIITIDGIRYIAEEPRLKTVHKDGEVVIGGFKEVEHE